jgi:hypothetical protein
VILVVLKPSLNSSFFGQKKYLMSITYLAGATVAKSKAEYEQNGYFSSTILFQKGGTTKQVPLQTPRLKMLTLGSERALLSLI